ncbi:hypothetical protein GCM10009601_32770 [Streptomyces thermospinosisporus]|uniref:FAD-dependent oxidoreductase n=1 Tax=Streptomyces thermospinosisporus TaxID=161482 RepID=A0ABN1YYW1_9ACTN
MTDTHTAGPFDEQFRFPADLLEARPGATGRVAVIGGGISGLACAYELVRRGLEVTVYERSGRPGGRIRTHRFWDGTHGELGAMRLPSNHHTTLHYVRHFRLPTRTFVNANPDAYLTCAAGGYAPATPACCPGGTGSPAPRPGTRASCSRTCCTTSGTGCGPSTPAAAAVLIALSPFFTALFARLAGERAALSAARAAAAGTVAFAGVVLVVLGRESGTSVPEATQWQGHLMALLAAALWGWYPVVTRPLLRHHSPLRVTAWTSAAGTAVLLPLAAVSGFTVHGTVSRPLSWASLAYSVLLVTVAGPVLWYRAVGQAGSAAVMLWMVAVPVAAALFAALTGEQALTWPLTAGSALVLVALAHAQGLSLGALRAARRPSLLRFHRNAISHTDPSGRTDSAGRTVPVHHTGEERT